MMPIPPRDPHVRGPGPNRCQLLQYAKDPDLDPSAINGPVTVCEVSGRIRAETRNGPLTLDRLAGDIHARTWNGPVTVTLTGTRTRRLDATLSDGGPRVRVVTTNGPVSVRRP